MTVAQTEKIGFRRALVVQEPLVDQEGLTFLFEINNIRIFCGGMRLLLTILGGNAQISSPQVRTGSRQIVS